MGFIFADYQTYIVGEAAHESITNFLFTASLGIVLFELARNSLGYARPPAKRKLTMKKLKNLSGDFLREGATHSNPLFKEHNFRFFVLGDVVDYAVMKLVSDDVPILADQEHQHAKLHHMAQKASPECQEWFNQWIAFGFDKLFLRLPYRIRAAFTYAMEAMSPWSMWFHAVSPLSRGMYSNLHLFHAYEEIEHASVTTHHLIELCPLPMRILALPLFGLAMELMIVVIPIWIIPCTIWNQPKVALKPRFWLLDIPCFFLHMTIMEYLTMPWVLLHVVCGIPHFDWFIKRAYTDIEAIIKERGFEWDVVQEEEFVLDKSLHKKAPKKMKVLEWSFYYSLVEPFVAPACKLGQDSLDFLLEVMDRPITEFLPEDFQLDALLGSKKQPITKVE